MACLTPHCLGQLSSHPDSPRGLFSNLRDIGPRLKRRCNRGLWQQKHELKAPRSHRVQSHLQWVSLAQNIRLYRISHSSFSGRSKFRCARKPWRNHQLEAHRLAIWSIQAYHGWRASNQIDSNAGRCSFTSHESLNSYRKWRYSNWVPWLLSWATVELADRFSELPRKSLLSPCLLGRFLLHFRARKTPRNIID